MLIQSIGPYGHYIKKLHHLPEQIGPRNSFWFPPGFWWNNPVAEFFNTIHSMPGLGKEAQSYSYIQCLLYTHISQNRGTNVHFLHTAELKLGDKLSPFLRICDVSDASSRAFCHRFARWRRIVFHILTIGGLLVPQFCMCINTNSSVEEDSLFGLRQPVMISEGR